MKATRRTVIFSFRLSVEEHERLKRVGPNISDFVREAVMAAVAGYQPPAAKPTLTPADLAAIRASVDAALRDEEYCTLLRRGMYGVPEFGGEPNAATKQTGEQDWRHVDDCDEPQQP